MARPNFLGVRGEWIVAELLFSRWPGPGPATERARRSIQSFRRTGATLALSTVSRTVKNMSGPVQEPWTPHGIDPLIRSDPKLPQSVGPARAAVVQERGVGPSG
jgi:hypothetical protein